MAPQQQYTLDDFQRFATANFPEEYALVADFNLYRFENIWAMNEQNVAQETTLLFIGRYCFTKSGGPGAWAHVATSGVTYYSGKANNMCKPVLAYHQSWIYPDYPFDLMLKSESSQLSNHGEYPKWIVKESVIEAIINFAFLFATQLEYIENLQGTDMLSDFAVACYSFHKYKLVRTAIAASPRQRPALVSSRAIPEVRARSEHIPNGNARGVENERGAARNIPGQRPLIEGDATAFDPSQQRKCIQVRQHQLR
jgi:hypothetical protein